MGTIPASMRPRYDAARVKAREIFDANPKITSAQIVQALKDEGFEFANFATVKLWRRDDVWPQRFTTVVNKFDKATRALLSQPTPEPIRSGKVGPVITADRMEQLEDFHGGAIRAGGTLVEKLSGWAEGLDADGLTVDQGLDLMREIPPFLESMAKLQILIVDAKHHMPVVSPDPPRQIEGETVAQSPLADVARKITEELEA